MSNTKGELRSKLREKRLGLVEKTLSLNVQRAILNDSYWQSAKIVALYAATSEEIDTFLLHNMGKLLGKQILFPRIVNGVNTDSVRQKDIEFALCLDTALLVKGAYSIMEPDCNLCPALPESVLPDLIIVPGIAFDKLGYRLGYGAGYYDRLFARPLWAQVKKIGLCASELLLDSLPHDSWDQKVDAIATEKGVLWL